VRAVLGLHLVRKVMKENPASVVLSPPRCKPLPRFANLSLQFTTQVYISDYRGSTLKIKPFNKRLNRPLMDHDAQLPAGSAKSFFFDYSLLAPSLDFPIQVLLINADSMLEGH